MGKSILMIHGRDFKPPEDDLKKLWLEALRFGLERDHAAQLADFDAATKELVYYGDISNAWLSKELKQPIPNDLADRIKSLKQLKGYTRGQFTKTNYNKLPGKEAWKEALADTLAGPLSFFGLSNPVIEAVAPDMREYWNPTSQLGSDLRFPMIAPLKQAMSRGDEILVIAHSLGTMIAYDTFWKFCRMGEYRPEFTDKKISLWITLGSPLADETVKRNLYGADASGERGYPNNVVRWLNIAAEDDYICHDGEVANDFKEMKTLKCIKSIADKPIYNLAVRNGESNPHNEVGYLVHPAVADAVAAWL